MAGLYEGIMTCWQCQCDLLHGEEWGVGHDVRGGHLCWVDAGLGDDRTVIHNHPLIYFIFTVHAVSVQPWRRVGRYWLE